MCIQALDVTSFLPWYLSVLASVIISATLQFTMYSLSNACNCLHVICIAFASDCSLLRCSSNSRSNEVLIVQYDRISGYTEIQWQVQDKVCRQAKSANQSLSLQCQAFEGTTQGHNIVQGNLQRPASAISAGVDQAEVVRLALKAKGNMLLHELLLYFAPLCVLKDLASSTDSHGCEVAFSLPNAKPFTGMTQHTLCMCSSTAYPGNNHPSW